jgi:hypothetical protein
MYLLSHISRQGPAIDFKRSNLKIIQILAKLLKVIFTLNFCGSIVSFSSVLKINGSSESTGQFGCKFVPQYVDMHKHICCSCTIIVVINTTETVHIMAIDRVSIGWMRISWLRLHFGRLAGGSGMERFTGRCRIQFGNAVQERLSCRWGNAFGELSRFDGGKETLL